MVFFEMIQNLHCESVEYWDHFRQNFNVWPIKLWNNCRMLIYTISLTRIPTFISCQTLFTKPPIIWSIFVRMIPQKIRHDYYFFRKIILIFTSLNLLGALNLSLVVIRRLLLPLWWTFPVFLLRIKYWWTKYFYFSLQLVLLHFCNFQIFLENSWYYLLLSCESYMCIS